MRVVFAPQHGMPLGNVLAWLEHAPRHDCQAGHQSYTPNRAERVQARSDFARGGHPLADVLFSCDRPQMLDEDAEPLERP